MGVISSLVAGTIGVTALAGVGAAAAIAANQPKKKPAQPETPQAPDVESVEDIAKAEMLKKRRIIERTGGKTILTSQYGGNTDTAAKTLLGE